MSADEPIQRWMIEWIPEDAVVHDDCGWREDLADQATRSEVCRLETRARRRVQEITDAALNGRVELTLEHYESPNGPWRSVRCWIFEGGVVVHSTDIDRDEEE